MKITVDYKNGGAYDVIVCGGGPSGVAAAVACARAGVKVLLIEQGGCLGGFWTRGLLTWLIDTFDKGALLDELMERLEKDADGKAFRHMPRFTADTEKTKLVLERLCREAGVDILYHTFVSGAVVENERISAVLTESKSGRVCYAGRMFIDATGDGDLSYLAGADYELGNEEGKTQPLSLIAHVSGVDTDAFLPYDSRYTPNKQAKSAILEDMRSAGAEPSYRAPLIALLSEKYKTFGFMTDHQYKSGLDNAQLTQATLDAREEIHAVTNALRSVGGVWKELCVSSTADMIGVREGRRIRGLYRLTADDVNQGRCFEDGICTVGFKTDVHDLSKDGGESERKKYGKEHPPYQIPMRSLISADIKNLLMAGRCISGDFVAHSSYRVAGPAFRTGEVSGLIAAYCIKNSAEPAELRSSHVLFE